MATDNLPRPGDSDVVLIRKILKQLGGTPKPGDSAYIMLRKILTLLAAFISPADVLHHMLEKLAGGGVPCPDCPDCPDCPIVGPALMHSRVVALSWDDFEVEYDLYQKYDGSPSDPAGATQVQVQIGHRPVGGEINWRTDVQAIWSLTIGAAETHISDAITAVAETDKVVLRFRFLAADDSPLSEWMVTDEWTTT